MIGRWRVLAPLVGSIALVLVLAGALWAWRGGSSCPTDNELRSRATRAVEWLRTQQGSDGAFGTSWGATADAVYVIALYARAFDVREEDPGGPKWQQGGQTALEALAQQARGAVAKGDVGTLAKVARAVAAAGRDPRAFAGIDLIARLWAQYDPQTGRFHPGNNFRQALVLQALLWSGERVPAEALAALYADQQANGGWGWPHGSQATDVDTTGLVLETLAMAGVPANDPHVQRAIAYLRAHQNPDGGWSMTPDRPTNVNSTALAMRGLLAYGEDLCRPPYRRDALFPGRSTSPWQVLWRLQEPDGGFRWTERQPGTRVLSTTDALPVILRPWELLSTSSRSSDERQR